MSHGIYVAFNGMGTTDPTKSDMKYYALLQSWNKSNKYTFSFSDSHKKTYSVRDSSQLLTLKARLLERLKNSKVLLLITTEFSSINRGLLNWEIEKAVDTHNLPIIVCYPGYNWVQAPAELSDRWPEKLRNYVATDSVKTIHIPFRQSMVEEAINQFSVHNPPSHTLTYYLDSVYQKHGIK
jgi:hypothetical protein